MPPWLRDALHETRIVTNPCSTHHRGSALLCAPMSEDMPTSQESTAAPAPATESPRKKTAKKTAAASATAAKDHEPKDDAVEPAKRNKRRRRKGKGGGESSAKQDKPAEETVIEIKSEIKAEAPPAPAKPNPPQRPRHDPGQLAKFAWKIYLAEVSEEGVALIHDNDAKELARRCFRLAEIFLDESFRHG